MRYVYRLDKLCCANCAAKIESAVRKIDGVMSAAVVFMTVRLTIEADESAISGIEEKAASEIRKIEPEVRMRRV